MTSTAETKLYTWEEIRRHDNDKDCWVVIYGTVCDMTPFLSRHPGGLNPIVEMAGHDITNLFESIAGHTQLSTDTWKKHAIGKLDPTSKPPIVKRKKVKDTRPIQYGTISPKVLLLGIAAVLMLVVLFTFS